jgi:Family of unknown function (DUF5522)
MAPERLIPGVDYYVENGFWVFTAHYLRRRGFCCRSGCRHCPYGYRPGEDGKDDEEKGARRDENGPA